MIEPDVAPTNTATDEPSTARMTALLYCCCCIAWWNAYPVPMVKIEPGINKMVASMYISIITNIPNRTCEDNQSTSDVYNVSRYLVVCASIKMSTIVLESSTTKNVRSRLLRSDGGVGACRGSSIEPTAVGLRTSISSWLSS